MITIHIPAEYKEIVNKNKLEIAAQTVLNSCTCDQNLDATIEIVNNNTIQQLNKKYRSIDKPTDVLAFDFAELNPENNKIYLGDVVISYQTAESNAASSSHDVIEELQLLVIHGILHLLGYNHEGDEEKRIMWDTQAQLLNKIGISQNILNE